MIAMNVSVHPLGGWLGRGLSALPPVAVGFAIGSCGVTSPEPTAALCPCRQEPAHTGTGPWQGHPARGTPVPWGQHSQKHR